MLTSIGSPGDLSEIGILSGDGYADIGLRDPAVIAALIMQRLRGTPPGSPAPTKPASATTAPATAHPAVAIWKKKLDSLLTEEAKAVDPAMKFKTQQDIDEAREKIRELGG